MELGEKLRAARLEVGLSQRQLCGDVITRNMLSQIENGAARPSIDTLRYLAGRLGKSLSYFLEDQAVTSPNLQTMEQARTAYSSGAYSQAQELLTQYRSPDPVFDWEFHLLLALCLMALAKQATAEDRRPYAEDLLHQAARAGGETPYFSPVMERERLLLLAEVSPAPVTEAALIADDRELLLRAEAALARNDPARCAAYLDAAQNRDAPRWHLLRGEADFAKKDYSAAAAHFHRAEEAYPLQTVPQLEACYRELGDFKRAYEYACKQR